MSVNFAQPMRLKDLLVIFIIALANADQQKLSSKLELVSKELNHLRAILHVYAGRLIFMKQKKNIIIFQK